MLEVGPGFPCINCGAETQLFFSTKTGARVAWSCPSCKARGWFMGEAGKEAAMIMDA